MRIFTITYYKSGHMRSFLFVILTSTNRLRENFCSYTKDDAVDENFRIVSEPIFFGGIIVRGKSLDSI